MLILECFIRNTFGRWQSVGTEMASSDEVLKFLSKDDGTSPRLCILEILRRGDYVVFVRGISLTRVPTERSICLFDTEKEAKDFEERLKLIPSNSAWASDIWEEDLVSL